ncbi:MAG: PTS sugar transporter subunit IIA [Kiritimatiellia bacterium]|jgi:mannitol/fructose-specific phosphotransferase system IIA component (Ntr-type)/predicted transcriptional regulator
MAKQQGSAGAKNVGASDLSTFFSADDLVCGTAATDRDGIIGELLALLAENHPEIKDVDEARRLVVEREEVRPTIVAHEVAMPHARIGYLSRPYVAIATAKTGIDFAPDAAPVRIVALVLTPLAKPALYLQIVKTLATVMRGENAVETMASFSDPEELRRHLLRGGLRLPDYICAADIMAPVRETLRENDSIKTAIDRFVQGDITRIPVTDKEGDLVGVVSASALLRVCLPNYLLWMDDLSPIQNFEPFAEVLRNEQNSWLGDILDSEHFSSVQITAPAIEIAAEFIRKNDDVCYVLDGQQLAGEVTLQHFLAKVFRN